MKNTTENTIHGLHCRRVPFERIKVGDVIVHAEKGVLGKVVAVELYPNSKTPSAIEFDNGNRRSYRGSKSTRFWKTI